MFGFLIWSILIFSGEQNSINHLLEVHLQIDISCNAGFEINTYIYFIKLPTTMDTVTMGIVQ